jgi:hypothetical protein
MSEGRLHKGRNWICSDETEFQRARSAKELVSHLWHVSVQAVRVNRLHGRQTR